jgi:hypothetical protein
VRKRSGGLTHIGELFSPKLLRQIKGPTPIQKRIIEAAAEAEPPDARSILYQHTVLCQTCLPYRDPGADVRTWERFNGNVHLELSAGKAMHPEQGRLVPIPLPFGPKCRLVLMHINQRALQTRSSHIEVEDSLTAFVRRVLKLDPKGRNIRMVKDQLTRLSAASITLGMTRQTPTGNLATTGHLHVIEHFEVWFPKDERQRVFWPSMVDLSPTYFESLLAHAVPLNESHIAALSHSAMALDIYAWLAQRLCRVPPGKGAFISWAALYGQFGQGYNRLNNFRAAFRTALREVLAVYRNATITEDQRKPPRLALQGSTPVWREPALKGLTLHHSLPPVPRLLHPVAAPTPEKTEPKTDH